MKYIIEYGIMEKLGDRITEPNIIQDVITIDESLFWISVANRRYLVTIMLQDNNYQAYTLHGNQDKPATLRVDFMGQEGAEDDWRFGGKLTGDGEMIAVMSNVFGVVRHWASQDVEDNGVKLADVEIGSICISAKKEFTSDRSRSDIYRYYLHRCIDRMGLEILSEKDRSKKFARAAGDYDPQITIIYDITPITVEELGRKLSTI